MASVHDWSLVNITSSSSTISHLHCVLSLHTAARRLSPPHLIFLFLPNFLCSFNTLLQMRLASKAFLSWFMGAGGENRQKKKEKRRVPQLTCRRVSLVTCHVFSFCSLERGVVIMCWVVHSGSEGHINKESGSLFAVVPSQDTMTGAIHHFCP